MTSLGFIKLEIPTSVPEPPTGEGWIHEIKYDGYRTLIVIDRDKVRAYSRPPGIGPDHIAGWSMLAPTWAANRSRPFGPRPYRTFSATPPSARNESRMAANAAHSGTIKGAYPSKKIQPAGNPRAAEICPGSGLSLRRRTRRRTADGSLGWSPGSGSFPCPRRPRRCGRPCQARLPRQRT
jgi:hypothetical protein